MNIGIISTRYAKALLRFAVEKHEEAITYERFELLAEMFQQVPALTLSLQNPAMSTADKIALLKTGCGGSISPSVERFFGLVIKRARMEILPFIVHSYLTLYRREKRIVKGRLIVSRPIGEQLKQRLCDMVELRAKGNVQFEEKIDSSLGGGFILEYDTYRLDASVRGQIQNLRRSMTK